MTLLKTTSLLTISACIAHGADLFVDPARGDDSRSGATPELAFRTVEAARDHIRKHGLNRNMTADLMIRLRGGRYEIRKTLEFTAQDSGSNGKRVIYQNVPGETPVFCGGEAITGWQRVAGKPYYQAAATAALKRSGYFRQLYVDGVRAQRARSNTFHTNARNTWWDDPATPEPYDGFWIKARDYTQVPDMQVFYGKVFKVGYMPVDSIIPSDRPDEMIVKMKQPDFATWMTWDDVKKNPKFEYMMLNAMEELDEPGEWYVNRATGRIYYYPATPDQDLAKVDAYVPATEFLLSIKGTAGAKAHDLEFRGITFQHGNWLAPEKRFLGRTQAEIDENYQSEIPGQIILDHADRITIRDCRIERMASVGIQLYEACDDVLIEGNVCYDLTAAGVSVGRWYMNKMDCPAETICRDPMVRNNVVRNTGKDYEQATGLNVFAAYGCKFHHNDVSDTAYTGIHARIGDTGSVRKDIGAIEYKYNKVSRSMTAGRYGMDDGGHLYLHGVYPGSVVEGNYSLYDSSLGHGWEFYSDNWSRDIHWLNNVSRYSIQPRPVCWAWHPATRNVVYENIWSDKKDQVGQATAGRAKLINYVWVKDDHWPPEAVRIMDNAGLEPAYRHLLDSIYDHRSLTEGRPFSASSSLDEAHGPKAADDRNWNSFWETKIGGDGEGWLAVDLGKSCMIQHLEILPRRDLFQDHARKEFEVQGSNDPGFKSYAVLAWQNDTPWYHGVQRNPSNLWERYLNPKAAYRYLRVKALNERGSFNLAEFNAYGYPFPSDNSHP